MKERLVFGVGINDLPGWRKKDCPIYGTWYSMLIRCYSRNFQKNNPSYKGVTVCEEWKSFSTFKQWMEKKDYKDKCLDKDILIPGNKEYGPDACMFVDPLINTQKVRIDPQKPIPGKKYPQGVHLRRNKGPNTYFSQIMIDGEKINIATFSTVEAASSAYCKEKAKHLRELAEKQEPALLRWADIYENANMKPLDLLDFSV
jgi:hypothetical protein